MVGIASDRAGNGCGLPGLAKPLRRVGVWAENVNEGNREKANPGYPQDTLLGCWDFLKDGPSLVSGDFNNQVSWDKPGRRMNQAD
jgi:hypothetical protein